MTKTFYNLLVRNSGNKLRPTEKKVSTRELFKLREAYWNPKKIMKKPEKYMFLRHLVEPRYVFKKASKKLKKKIYPAIEVLIVVVLLGLGGVGMYSLVEFLKLRQKKKYFKFGREKKRKKNFKSYKKRKLNFFQKKILKIALGEYSTAIKRKPSRKQRKIIYRVVKKIARGKNLTSGDIFKLRNLSNMINVQNLIKAHFKNMKKRII